MVPHLEAQTVLLGRLARAASGLRPGCRTRRAAARRFRKLEPVRAGSISGDGAAAAVIHPLVAGRSDVDGQLGPRALPVPRLSRRRVRLIIAAAAEDEGAEREIPVEARRRGTGA